MSEEQAVVEETQPTAEVSQDQNVSEQAPEDVVESPQTEKSDTDDTPRKPSQSKFDRKIDKLNRAIGEQKARADMLERQLQEARPKPEVKSDGIRLEDFDFDVDKYAEAKVKAAEEATLKRLSEEQKAQSFKKAQESLINEWEIKSSKADSKYDDWDEVVGEMKPVSQLSIAIMQAENGVDIAYYLGKNIKEAHRIAALDPIAGLREIGKLEAKLLAEPLKARTPSNAPAPITPVKGSGVSNKTIFDDNLSQEEFEKIRNKQLKRR